MKIPCPICKKMTDTQGNLYKPFCSERCKLADLGAWFDEDYTIKGQSEPFSQTYSPTNEEMLKE